MLGENVELERKKIHNVLFGKGKLSKIAPSKTKEMENKHQLSYPTF